MDDEIDRMDQEVDWIRARLKVRREPARLTFCLLCGKPLEECQGHGGASAGYVPPAKAKDQDDLAREWARAKGLVWCSSCQRALPDSAFGPNKRTCRSCQARQSKASRVKRAILSRQQGDEE